MGTKPSIPPIPPMLAKGPAAPFDSDKHAFEIKWDGTRCIAFVNADKVTLQNRRLRDVTRRYPEFQSWRLPEGIKSAVLDGEIVAMEKGLPDFSRLQQREHTEDPMKIDMLSRRVPATYIAFDLLYLNGKPLLKSPLEKRRELLKSLLPISDNVAFSESYTKGRALFKEVVKRGFEGVMAKEKGSPYLSGKRSGYWIKVKKSFDVDAVVFGLTGGLGGRGKYFGSLILGLYDEKGNPVYIGRVGTGLDENTLKIILDRLKGLQTASSPFEGEIHRFFRTSPDRKIVYVKPSLVVRAGYHEFTKDGRMRFPVFKGIRDDKTPAECTMETLASIG